MKFAVVRTLLVIALTSGSVHSQCVSEDTALGSCLETAGLTSRQEFICETCVGNVVVSTRTTECADLATASCPDIFSCECGSSCTSEILAYFTCETNDLRADTGAATCDAVACDDAATMEPVAPTTVETAPPVAAPTGFSFGCVDEDSALGTCLDNAGMSSAAEFICETCLGQGVLSSRSTACGELETVACPVIAACECGDACNSEILSYFTCESNDLRDYDAACDMLLCSSDGSTEPETPAATSPPTPSSISHAASKAGIAAFPGLVVTVVALFWNQI